MLPEAEFWTQLRERIVKQKRHSIKGLVLAPRDRDAGFIEALDWVLGQAADVIDVISGEKAGDRDKEPESQDVDVFDY